jgi:hypothetical protein
MGWFSFSIQRNDEREEPIWTDRSIFLAKGEKKADEGLVHYPVRVFSTERFIGLGRLAFHLLNFSLSMSKRKQKMRKKKHQERLKPSL